MLKGLLGVIAGVAVGIVTVFIAESAGHLVWPPPLGIDMNDPEALKELMLIAPIEAKLAVLIAWGLGTFSGSAVAINVSGRASWPAWLTAFILFGLALWTMTFIPHPDWMLFGATALTLVSAITAAFIWAQD